MRLSGLGLFPILLFNSTKMPSKALRYPGYGFVNYQTLRIDIIYDHDGSDVSNEQMRHGCGACFARLVTARDLA